VTSTSATFATTSVVLTSPPITKPSPRMWETGSAVQGRNDRRVGTGRHEPPGSQPGGSPHHHHLEPDCVIAACGRIAGCPDRRASDVQQRLHDSDPLPKESRFRVHDAAGCKSITHSARSGARHLRHVPKGQPGDERPAWSVRAARRADAGTCDRGPHSGRPGLFERGRSTVARASGWRMKTLAVNVLAVLEARNRPRPGDQHEARARPLG